MITVTQSNTNIKLDVFHVPNAAGFLWSEWEDASIVYDPRSGHTQVLNEFARELLALLEDGPKTTSDLCVEFEKIIETSLDPFTKGKIIETVNGFDTMGLIEPVR